MRDRDTSRDRPGQGAVPEDPALLREAIGEFRQAVAATPDSDLNRAMLLNNLGVALMRLSASTRDAAALAEAVKAIRAATAAAGHPDHAMFLSNLGRALAVRAARAGDGDSGAVAGTLAEAVEVSRAAVAATPAGHVNRLRFLDGLMRALFIAAVRSGDDRLMGEAVEAGREIAAGPADFPGRAEAVNLLGLVLTDRVQTLLVEADRTGDIAALRGAAALAREAVAAAPADHPDRASALNDLAVCLLRLYERTGEPGPLDEGVRTLRALVAATAPDDPDRPGRLNNLGLALKSVGERTGDPVPLTEAVAVAREALSGVAEDDPKRYMYLSTLATSLLRLSERSAGTGPLEEAVRTLRALVAATAPDDPDRPGRLNNLGLALLMRYERAGQAELVAEAVTVGREAAAAFPAGHPNRGICLNTLGRALLRLFQRTGDPGTAAEAVRTCREAVAATPAGHPTLHESLNSLGLALSDQALLTGDAGQLAEGAAVLREAVAAMPADHPARPVVLANIAEHLQILARFTGDTGLLAEAIQTAREALAVMPVDHSQRALCLTALSRTLGRLSSLTGDTAALAEAIEASREAVAITPAPAPGRALHLAVLMDALVAMFVLTGSENTLLLAAAVQAGRQAVAAAPVGEPSRAGYLSSLGLALQEYAERTSDASALAEAVRAGREAVAGGPPPGHPDRARALAYLSFSLDAQSGQAGDVGLLAEAARCAKEAAADDAAPAPVRVLACRHLADLASRDGRDPAEALAAAETAVALLPQISRSALSRDDRGYQLTEAGSVAALAAALAIKAGKPGRAVELLEQSRGVLVADTVGARSGDLARLRDAAPGLASSFQELQARREFLDQPDAPVTGAPDSLTARDQGPAHGGDGIAEARATARRETAVAWTELIGRIRAVDGMAGFLAPPSAGDLTDQAADGPVVYVAAARPRCDALMLTGDRADPVRVVPLKRLTAQDAVRSAEQLTAAQRTSADPGADPASRRAAQREVLAVLAWLWDAVAEPVLAALGYTGVPAPGQGWPRVWWCPVGVMAYLPLHAAGHHADLTAKVPERRASPRTALDRVISSYTTTVRGLAFARSQAAAAPAAGTGGVKTAIIAVPDAPGVPRLEGADAEAARLAALIPGAEVLQHPTRGSVLATLPARPAAHFACHAQFRRADPGRSRLILHDHQTAALTVADIAGLRLDGALAYLSACDTAVTGPEYADEAVHITGAFHLAGYAHVIGTMWSAADQAAARIAEDFYARLTVGGMLPPDPARSAEALHHAIRALRARYPAVPTLWAAHTHTGA